jgi:hypothetical protein
MLPPVMLGLVLVMLSGGCSDDSGSDSAGGATVTGTLTLPGTASGVAYGVRILETAGVPGAAPVAEANGQTTGAAMLDYSISGVPAGTYFVLAFVDVDGSGAGSSTPGDYAGWHAGGSNPPASPSAVVPATGNVRFDVSLVLR